MAHQYVFFAIHPVVVWISLVAIISISIAFNITTDHKDHYHFRRYKKLKIPILRNDNLEAMELLHRGLRFLDNIQNPINCTKHPYMISEIGVKGGFAAQFQSAASLWMRLLAETDFTIPILIRGKLIGYSEGKECAPYDYSWNCYFLPTSRCEQELLSTGILITKTKKTVSNEDSTPLGFQKFGFSIWWGIIQAYLFRLQPYIEQYILSITHKMSNGRAFPYGLPTIGIHVRHGDKHIDQWREFSLQDELQGILESSDCHIKEKVIIPATAVDTSNPSPTITIPTCFTQIQLDTDHLLLWRASHNQTIILRKAEIPKYLDLLSVPQSSVRLSQLHSLFHKEIVPIKELRQHIMYPHSRHSHGKGMNESTTSFYQSHHYHVDPFAYYHFQQYNLSDIIKKYRLQYVDSGIKAPKHHQQFSYSTEKSHIGEYVSPVDIFVASDDAVVIEAARNRSFFVNKEGVSQQTHGTPMILLVMLHTETSFEASLQILADIFLLSQCSTLIGTAGSQIFRIAVGLAKVKGFLHYAKALDYANLKKLRQMSRRYNVPCPEEFSP